MPRDHNFRFPDNKVFGKFDYETSTERAPHNFTRRGLSMIRPRGHRLKVHEPKISSRSHWTALSQRISNRDPSFDYRHQIPLSKSSALSDLSKEQNFNKLQPHANSSAVRHVGIEIRARIATLTFWSLGAHFRMSAHFPRGAWKFDRLRRGRLKPNSRAPEKSLLYVKFCHETLTIYQVVYDSKYCRIIQIGVRHEIIEN